MTRARLIFLFLLVNQGLCSQDFFSFSIDEHLFQESSRKLVSLNSDYNSPLDALQFGIKYDVEALDFDSIVYSSSWHKEDFEIFHDEINGIVAIKFNKNKSLFLGSRILNLEFVSNLENLDCTNLTFVDIDEETPISASQSSFEYFEDDINLSEGGICIKNKIDDALRQRYFDEEAQPALNVRVNTATPGSSLPNGAIGKDYFLQSVGNGRVIKSDRLGQFLGDYSLPNFDLVQGMSIIYDHKNEDWIIALIEAPQRLQIRLLNDLNNLDEYIGSFTYNFQKSILFPSFVLSGETLILSSKQFINNEPYFTYYINLEDVRNEVPNPRTKTLDLPKDYVYHYEHFLSPSTGNNPNGLAPENVLVLSLRDNDWYKEEGDFVELFEIDLHWENNDNPSFKRQRIPLTEYDLSNLFGIFTQDGSPAALNLKHPFITNPPQYQKYADHESLVFCFTTDVEQLGKQFGIRWVELRKTSLKDWHVFQEGTFAPEGNLDRYYGSIAIDDKENIFLVYNLSNAETYVNLGITGRNKEDPKGKMTFKENILEGENGEYPNVFGSRINTLQISQDSYQPDYFWFTANTSGGAKVIAVDFVRDDYDLSLERIEGLAQFDILQKEEELNLVVKNLGWEDVNKFTVEVFFDNQKVISEEINELIPFDEARLISLDQKLVLEKSGRTNVKVEIRVEEEEEFSNNTITTTIARVLENDANLELLSVDNDCRNFDNNKLKFLVRNTGFNAIDSAKVMISINGEKIQELTIDNLNRYSDTQKVDFELSRTLKEENQLKLSLKSIHVLGEEIKLDKNISVPYFKTDEKFRILDIGIQLDDRPGETTWVITELGTEEIVAEGGPYYERNKLVWQSLCLSPYDCYLFRINDLGGNGLTRGTSAYQLRTNFVTMLIDEGGDFGSSRAHGFCLDGDECQIKPNVLITDASTFDSTDGQIEIEILNRIEAFEYRVNGIGPFQSSPVFENLKRGYYTVEVQSEDGNCVYEEEVYLSFGNISTSSLNLDALTLQVYPNPSTGLVNLGNLDNYEELKVFTAAGNEVAFELVKKENTSQLQLNLSHLPKGLYFIKCQKKQLIYIGKVILQ